MSTSPEAGKLSSSLHSISSLPSSGDNKGTPNVNDALHRHAAAAETAVSKYAGHLESEFPKSLHRRVFIKSWLFYFLISYSYGLFFLCKIAISSAALLGLRTDLHMDNNKFGWLTSGYFVAYLIFCIPLSFVLVNYIGIRWAGAFMTVWGAVVMCMAACHNYAAFITCRVILGALESPFVSALNTLTAQLLPSRQHMSASSTYLGWCGWGVIFSNALGYGLYVRADSYSMAAWKIFFLIIGGVAVVSGAVFVLLVPNTPAEAWFFTEQEKECLAARNRKNGADMDSKHAFKWYQVREVFTTDAHHTGLLFINVFVNCIVMGAITTYQTILVEGIVKSPSRSLLMTLPGGGIQFGGCYIVAILSILGVFAKARSVYMIGAAVINVICTCLLSWGPQDASQLAGLWIWNFVGQVSYSGFLSLVQTNAVGSTKKVLMSGVVLCGYAAGNCVGPKLFSSGANAAAGNYSTAKSTMAALTCVSLGLQVALLVMNVIINKRRDARNEKLPADIKSPELADLTDIENPEFRYSY